MSNGNPELGRSENVPGGGPNGPGGSAPPSHEPMIVGWAHTKFGKSEAPDTMALMAEVAGPALAHAGVTADQVDGIFTGVWNNGFSRQDFQGALVAMGTPELAGVPFMRTENACATGSARPATPTRCFASSASSTLCSSGRRCASTPLSHSL